MGASRVAAGAAARDALGRVGVSEGAGAQHPGRGRVVGGEHDLEAEREEHAQHLFRLHRRLALLEVDDELAADAGPQRQLRLADAEADKREAARQAAAEAAKAKAEKIAADREAARKAATEAAQAEAARRAAARADPTKAEAAKVDAAKTDAGKNETAKADAAKDRAMKAVEAAKAQPDKPAPVDARVPAPDTKITERAPRPHAPHRTVRRAPPPDVADLDPRDRAYQDDRGFSGDRGFPGDRSYQGDRGLRADRPRRPRTVAPVWHAGPPPGPEYAERGPRVGDTVPPASRSTTCRRATAPTTRPSPAAATTTTTRRRAAAGAGRTEGGEVVAICSLSRRCPMG